MSAGMDEAVPVPHSAPVPDVAPTASAELSPP